MKIGFGTWLGCWPNIITLIMVFSFLKLFVMIVLTKSRNNLSLVLVQNIRKLVLNGQFKQLVTGHGPWWSILRFTGPLMGLMISGSEPLQSLMRHGCITASPTILAGDLLLRSSPSNSVIIKISWGLVLGGVLLSVLRPNCKMATRYWNSIAGIAWANFLGFSEEHSTLMAYVRSLSTNFVSPQLHVVLDKKFTTIHNDAWLNDTTIESIFNDLFEMCRYYFREESLAPEGADVNSPVTEVIIDKTLELGDKWQYAGQTTWDKAMLGKGFWEAECWLQSSIPSACQHHTRRTWNAPSGTLLWQNTNSEFKTLLERLSSERISRIIST